MIEGHVSRALKRNQRKRKAAGPAAVVKRGCEALELVEDAILGQRFHALPALAAPREGNLVGKGLA
jgi:hypothetical protein